MLITVHAVHVLNKLQYVLVSYELNFVVGDPARETSRASLEGEGRRG